VRQLRWLAGVLLIAGIAGIAGMAWLVATRSGAAWALARATGALEPELRIEAVEGSLAYGLTLIGVQYTDPDSGDELSVERIAVDAALGQLARRVVYVESARLQGVRLHLGDVAPSPEPPHESSAQRRGPPIDIVVRRLELTDLEIRRDAETLLVLESGELSFRWTRDLLAIDELYLRSPDGSARFAARLSTDQAYTAEGRGEFRWTLADVTYGGTLALRTLDSRMQLEAALSAPFTLGLDAELEPRGSWPWQLDIDLPPFDPSVVGLEASSLTNVGAQLQARGTLERARVTGELVSSAASVQLDTLALARSEDEIVIESLVARVDRGPAALRASGSVALDPRRVELALDWDEIELPAALAGQTLRTRGAASIAAHGEVVSVQSEFALGPPGRLADVQLALRATAEQIRLETLQVRQRAGSLVARGSVDLGDEPRWQIEATATDFDPGELLADWKGEIDLELASVGRLTSTGPTGRLDIERLGGRLRDRPISGQAHLTLTPGPVLAGELALRSGRSTLAIRGESGDVMEAAVELDVASLADWLPAAQGRLQARFTVRGAWPALAIAGRADGSNLSLAQVTVARLELVADVKNVDLRSGTLQLSARDVKRNDLEIVRIQASASGDARAQRFSLRAENASLAAHVALEGTRNTSGWSGVLQQLELELRRRNALTLALEEPSRIALDDSGGFVLGRTCLSGSDVQLCISGERDTLGAIRADYAATRVPLGLASSLAPGALPVVIDGMLSGKGELRRGASGRWWATSQLRSPSATVRISAEDPRALDVLETLLLYEDLRLDVELDGATASASVSARLIDDGLLEGRVAVSGLGTPRRPLEGRLEATLPTLAPIAAFAPRLDQVTGRVELSALVGGTLDAPAVEARAQVSGFGAQVPDLGLNLQEGTLRIEPRGDALALRGRLRSGAGFLEVDGTWSRGGELLLDASGERFLVSDLPGARVVATPDLRLARAAEGLRLTGSVRIPSARIDVRALPQGSAPRVSSDVIVVDRPTEAQASVGLPIRATVDVVLGSDVRIEGSGFEAQLAGRLTVLESPGLPTRASGEIVANGTYRAYGQDLTIERGQILFAASPLTNPQLNLTAARRVENVTAGLRVTGSARQPQVEVFSNPAMSQADALSYLVAGKPLAAVGSNPESAEGDALTTAARSLGTAAGSLLAERIGSRLGIDEIGIEKSDMLGGDAFTIGEYLSPRLYLGYGVGLFEAGEIITLRYRLTDALSIEAVRGPEETRTGIQIQIER